MVAREAKPKQRPGITDLVLLCARQARVLLLVTVGGTAFAVALALLLPQWYSAEITMLPASKAGKLLPLAAATGSITGGGGGNAALPLDLLGLGTGGDSWILVGVLKSRTVTDAVITKHGLQQLYGRRTIEDTRKALSRHVEINCDRKTNIVQVEVEDRDPQRARDMALTFADETNKIHATLEMNQAGQERRFLERRLGEVKKDLVAAETAFREFQTKHGLIDINEQTKATVHAVSNLRAELMAREVQQNYYSSYATGNEQNTLRIRREMSEIKRQLDRLEHAPENGGKAKGSQMHLMTPMTEIPTLALEYVRRARELKIQETLYELLTKQHELAKIAEARDTGTVQVIDQPVVATKRIRPKRGPMVIIGFCLTLAVAFFLGLMRDRLQRDPEQRRRWHEVAAALRGRAPPPPPLPPGGPA